MKQSQTPLRKSKVAISNVGLNVGLSSTSSLVTFWQNPYNTERIANQMV